MASFQIATIYKDLATLRGYEKCGLSAEALRPSLFSTIGFRRAPTSRRQFE
jgi:hypothetical protein